jgi:hypothetical protein
MSYTRSTKRSRDVRASGCTAKPNRRLNMSKNTTESLKKQVHMCECGCGNLAAPFAGQRKDGKYYFKGHGPRKRSDRAERFWSRVDKRGFDDCWHWTGRLSEHGYGSFDDPKKPKKAHRIAWELTYGPIPDSLCVLHSCDNPACCNPSHLWLGTQLENIADMWTKGRGSPPPHNDEKITPDEVCEIRNRRMHGETVVSIARVFDISINTVSRWSRAP